MSRDFYKILIAGQSGKGKTYMARTLDPDKTGYVNVEDKPLPFKNQFKHHARCRTTSQAKAALSEFAKNPDITVIYFDSFSAYIDILLAECRATKKGFDIWNTYNEEIGKLFGFIKSIQKEIFVIAHYEQLNIEGDQEKRTKVKGKEWEGLIEKEFTIVLYADRKLDDKGKVVAWLDLNLEGSSSKCPPDIFGEEINRIENDAQFIVDKIIAFAS